MNFVPWLGQIGCLVMMRENGELSVNLNSFAILTKSLLPLPDKYHGLTDVDKRYRQRYVDMIANPEVADIFRQRAKIVSEIRKTVESIGFVEVETPVLQGAAGGAEARPFVTHHNSLGRDLYLRIATELHLKRMLGVEICLERPWRRETMHNLVKEVTGIDFVELGNDLTAAKEVTIRTLGASLEHKDKCSIEACPSVGHVLNEVFEIEVEPKLLQPTFVLDYPIEISPLAKPH
ncbi:lysyl-tRNA synthetase, class II [Actinidia rufa]|uniref:Lysyl-tRNA synthetase, class II n=1 Tax=Actinidia rufa TaxID=165716 RepID=A0A7J0H592_9ERIC|nr:lysyl-tRNA synthetase, class II [Actinidia rufa]